jgi:hypothetical protein
MLIRLLFLAALVLASPAATWPAGLCCRAADRCCADERPGCPAPAGGECSIATARPTLATVNVRGHEALAAARAPATRDPALLPATSLAGRPAALYPPRFQLFQPLRN